MSPSTTAKDAERGVVWLALVCHLKWSRSGGNRGGGDHVQQAGVRVKRFAPKSSGKASAVQHGNNVLLERAIAAFRNAALLQHALHSVLATNAGLCKVCVPDVANVLAALVVVQTLDRHAVLEFDEGLERLERFEHVRLVLEQISPPIAQPVVNEGDPVAISQGRGDRNHVHIRVNALQQAHCAVRSLLGEGVGVVFANDARLAVQKQRGVVVNDKAVSDVALDCLL
jgi:hypothetical protein